METIFTLNARGNVMLEVVRDHFGLAAPELRREIQGLHSSLLEILASKGVQYDKLRSGLVPAMDRHEVALIFDSTKCGSDLYGPEVFRYVLPLLEARTTQSILVGDLLGGDQRLVREILQESAVVHEVLDYQHSTQLYCVYINNLSDTALRRLHAGLVEWAAYIGYIPTTYASRAKTYLSQSVVSFILKNGKKLLIAHEDDRDNSENVNITYYPLDSHGYEVVSLQGMYFSLFLAFKIERPVFSGFQVDTEISLNAISDTVDLFDDYTVVLDERKYGYLLNEKLGKLQKAGLDSADREYITELICKQLSSNYIYNLSYLEDHDVMKFNLMLEVGHPTGYPTKLVVALEYLPKNQILRVITLH